jgi:hypothetical protein
MENITVRNPKIQNAVPSAINNCYFGGLIGRLEFSGTVNRSLYMTNCDLILSQSPLELDAGNCDNLYYGGFIGYTSGVFVIMGDCNVQLGGSSSQFGLLLDEGSIKSFVGAAFGYAKTCNLSTSQEVGCSLSGYMLYTGSFTTNLNKILGGKGTGFHMSGSIDHDNLHLYKRNSSTSTATPVTTTGI